MNNYRRNEISKIIHSLEDLKAKIEELHSEEQESFDNMPENLQNSERGENMQSALYSFDEAESSIDETLDALNEIVYN